MSVDSTSILTLAETKVLLNISDDDTDKDTLMESLIDKTTSLLEAYCDRQFVAREYTDEYHDGDGASHFHTDQYPINSVTSLYDDGTRQFGDDSLISSDNYVTYNNEGKVQLTALAGSQLAYYARFGNSIQNIKISYNAGFTTIPNDLKMIAIEIVMKKLTAYDSRRVGAKSVTTHGDTVSIHLGDILPEHKIILNAKYRKENFA